MALAPTSRRPGRQSRSEGTPQPGGTTGRGVHRVDPARVGVVAAGLAVVAAVVAAVVRVFVTDWYPVGENALFAIRGTDVFTEHHPLLGTSTSASEIVGFNFNNPGSLLFFVLALPAKVGPQWVAVGMALLVLGSVAAMAACAGRVAGARGVLAALFAAAALAWVMGPELLLDPWQPNALLFPFLALIVATWATCAGSDGSLVVAAGLASLVLQTHLSYAVLVGVLAMCAGSAVLIRAVRAPERRRHAGRVLAGTAVLLAVLWAQPLFEQVTADEQGNLARIAEVPGAERGESVGGPLGIRLAGRLLSPLPRWAPPSYDDAYEQVPVLVPIDERFVDLPSLPVAGATLAATLLAVGAVLAFARRTGRRPLASGAAIVAVTVVVTTTTATMLPVSWLGLPAHHVRWMWPAAIAVTTVLVGVALLWRAGVALVAAATVVMAVLAMPSAPPGSGPASATDLAAPAIWALEAQLDELDVDGPLLVEAGPLAIDDQYTLPVILELDRRFGVTLRDPVLVRQLGDGRAATGSEPGRVRLALGSDPDTDTAGFRRVAAVEGLSPAEAEEFDELTRVLSTDLQDGGLRLTGFGVHVIEAGIDPQLDDALEAGTDPIATLGQDRFWGALQAGLIEPERRRADVRRWMDLWSKREYATVSVWLDEDPKGAEGGD